MYQFTSCVQGAVNHKVIWQCVFWNSSLKLRKQNFQTISWITRSWILQPSWIDFYRMEIFLSLGDKKNFFSYFECNTNSHYEAWNYKEKNKERMKSVQESWLEISQRKKRVKPVQPLQIKIYHSNTYKKMVIFGWRVSQGSREAASEGPTILHSGFAVYLTHSSNS